jgi:hypothetical protein
VIFMGFRGPEALKDNLQVHVSPPSTCMIVDAHQLRTEIADKKKGSERATYLLATLPCSPLLRKFEALTEVHPD